jgi:hypothetical protein
MFYLQIDKKKKTKNCLTAHSQNILHVDVLFSFYYFFNQNFLLSFNILFEKKNLSKTIRVA